MNEEGKIALIYFSRSAKSEAEHKNWATYSTRAQRKSISSFLSNHTSHVLKNSGLEVLRFDEGSQVGSSFGEKIANAFATTFSMGYTMAISVGNDCLSLEDVDFTAIQDHLYNGNGVLGPTIRKGAYLIGMSASSFNSEKFSGLRWQSEHLEDDLKAYLLGQCCGVEVLERLRDINYIRDFKAVLSKIKKASIIRKVTLFLRAFSFTPITWEKISHSFSSAFIPDLRGPPVSL